MIDSSKPGAVAPQKIDRAPEKPPAPKREAAREEPAPEKAQKIEEPDQERKKITVA